MKKICSLFGYLATIEPKVNGQTVRTRNFKRLLEERLGYEVDYYDTQLFPKKPPSIIKKLFKIRNSDFVFMSFAHRGVLVLLPLITLFCIFFKKKSYYIAIGGWLPSFLVKYKYLQWFIIKQEILFVQSEILAVEIKKAIPNSRVEVLPNFKFYDYNFHISKNLDDKNELRVVFLSKICFEKGFDTIVSICNLIENSKLPINIDLYGPVDLNFTAILEKELELHRCLNYRGVLGPERIYCTLSKYDVMIFPTHYRTEGFPGVILDAFIAGLPVIASDWKFSSDFIKSDFGFIFKHNDPQQAFAFITTLLNNPELLFNMKQSSLNNRRKYDVISVEALMKSWGF